MKNLSTWKAFCTKHYLTDLNMLFIVLQHCFRIVALIILWENKFYTFLKDTLLKVLLISFPTKVLFEKFHIYLLILKYHAPRRLLSTVARVRSPYQFLDYTIIYSYIMRILVYHTHAFIHTPTLTLQYKCTYLAFA